MQRKPFCGVLHAVAQEPWIIAVCATHVALLLLVVLTRNNTNVQTFIFALASAWGAACLALQQQQQRAQPHLALAQPGAASRPGRPAVDVRPHARSLCAPQ